MIGAQNQPVKVREMPILKDKLLLSLIPSLHSPAINLAMEFVQRKKAKSPEVPIKNLITSPREAQYWEVKFQGKNQENGLLCVYDMDENLIVQEIVQLKIGLNQYHLNMESVSKGEYLVKICTSEEIYLGVVTR